MTFGQFNYNVYQCSPIWGPLDLMDLYIHFSLQVWEVFSYYCFLYTLCPFLFCFWNSMIWISILLIVSNKSCGLSSLFFTVIFNSRSQQNSVCSIGRRNVYNQEQYTQPSYSGMKAIGSILEYERTLRRRNS